MNTDSTCQYDSNFNVKSDITDFNNSHFSTHYSDIAAVTIIKDIIRWDLDGLFVRGTPDLDKHSLISLFQICI